MAETKPVERALALVGCASYLWLSLSWFDHEIPTFPAATPPLVPLALFLASVGTLLWRKRRALALGADARIAVGLGLLGFLTRLPFVFQAFGLFSSDASAQGVMALHVLEGRHHPIFLYNWSYIGSLKAHFTALLGGILGEPVVGFALAAALVYGALTASVYLLGRTVLPVPESAGAALYVVLAPGFLTAWGVGNEGNYPDVIVLGTFMLVLVARFLAGGIDGAAAGFWIGVLGGVAFWIHILATYYLIAVVAVLLLHRIGRASIGRLGAFTLGFFLGDFPGILWNVSHGFLSFRWWALDASTAESGVERLARATSQLRGVFTSSFAVLSGYWPKESPPAPELFFRLFLLALIPVTFLVFAWKSRAKLRLLRRGKLTPETVYLGFAVLVVLVFAQSSFGWMTEEPRYLLFLFSVVPVFLASSLGSLARRSSATAAIVVALLVFVSLRGGLLHYRTARESDAKNREFLERLEEIGVRYVQSDYHLSYKYVFLSHGRMVWTSELGPSQTEWYLPFRDQVRAAEAVALVPRSYRFARRIERRLDALGVRYRRENLLYPVLFDFSEKVSLEELR